MQQRHHGLVNNEHREPADDKRATARAKRLALIIEYIRLLTGGSGSASAPRGCCFSIASMPLHARALRSSTVFCGSGRRS